MPLSTFPASANVRRIGSSKLAWAIRPSLSIEHRAGGNTKPPARVSCDVDSPHGDFGTASSEMAWNTPDSHTDVRLHFVFGIGMFPIMKSMPLVKVLRILETLCGQSGDCSLAWPAAATGQVNVQRVRSFSSESGRRGLRRDTR